jgi:hypothetical protein
MTSNQFSLNDTPRRSLRVLLMQCLIFLSACNQAIAPSNASVAPPDIRVDGDVIYFFGLLNPEVTKAVTPHIVSGKYKTLRITSPGGDVLSAMDFGALVYDYGLNVTVDKECQSSCANYIFPAGKSKTIESDSLIVWHGDARQRDFLEKLKTLESKAKAIGMNKMSSVEQSELKHFRHMIEKQDVFYKKIGIDGSIARIGQEIDLPVQQWAMPAETMAAFGISNIDAPPDYGTKEYCQRWVAARNASKVNCLNLKIQEIQAWRIRPAQ